MENVRVITRFRPLNEKEVLNNEENSWTLTPNQVTFNPVQFEKSNSHPPPKSSSINKSTSSSVFKTTACSMFHVSCRPQIRQETVK